MTEISLELDGPGAPPRLNGELVFDAPWQSRVFGLTAALVETGRLDWAGFQQALIARVGAADAVGADDYWGCWRDAFGDCCAALGLVNPDDWSQRTTALLSRPAGHDHDHTHHHDHPHPSHDEEHEHGNH